jgi:hypothetical protein
VEHLKVVTKFHWATIDCQEKNSSLFLPFTSYEEKSVVNTIPAFSRETMKIPNYKSKKRYLRPTVVSCVYGLASNRKHQLKGKKAQYSTPP